MSFFSNIIILPAALCNKISQVWPQIFNCLKNGYIIFPKLHIEKGKFLNSKNFKFLVSRPRNTCTMNNYSTHLLSAIIIHNKYNGRWYMYSKCMYSPHTLVVMQPGLCCIVLLTASMTLTLLDTLKYGTSEHNTANTPEASSKLRERRERERERERERWGEREWEKVIY